MVPELMAPTARTPPMRTRPATTLASLLLLAACSAGDGSSESTGPTPPNPKFDITIPQSASIRQGAGSNINIAIARTDYTGPVFVTFAGLPTGVTAPIVSSTSTNAFNIQLLADSTAALGTKTVTVNAYGIDVPQVNKTLPLTVTPK